MYSQMSLPENRNWTLAELSEEKASMLIPSVVYLCVLMVTGVCGNLVVIIVYYFRFTGSTHRCFILVLASSDLFACSVGVPFAISESFHAYNYTEHISCRLLRFVLYYTCICSSLTLVLIALERFRKICRPLKPQMTVPMAKKALVFVNAGVAFVSASPSLVLFGRNSISTGVSNMTGTKCFISDSFIGTIWPTVFNVYLLCLAIASTICMSVCYICVARRVSNVGKEKLMKRKYFQNGDCSRVCQTIASDTEADSELMPRYLSQDETLGEEGKRQNNCFLVPDTGSNMRTSISRSSLNRPTSATDSSFLGSDIGTKTKSRVSATPSQWAIKVIKHLSVSKLRDKTIRITRMLIAVTAVFVLSYLPHLTLMLWDMFTETYDSLPKDNVYQVIFYSFFLNNLINPFIYALMDLKFRTECKKLLTCKKN